MTSPQLEQYPGYFPEGSRPFWTRTKVGVVTGVVGLLLGVGASGEAPPEDEPPAVVADPEVEEDLEEALADNAELETTLQEVRDEAADELSATTKQVKKQAKATQRTAVQAAVAKVRSEERRKAAVAVQAARTAAAAAAAPAAASAPVPLASSGGSTDPRFNYCYEANDAGYGPYYQGQDPEYDWYDDNDGDGIVCET